MNTNTITADVDRGLAIVGEMEALKSEMKAIEARLAAAALEAAKEGLTEPLVDEEREGRRYFAEGSLREPSIFLALNRNEGVTMIEVGVETLRGGTHDQGAAHKRDQQRRVLAEKSAFRLHHQIEKCSPKPQRDTIGRCHSITSSARIRMAGGIMRPRVAAVRPLTTSSNLVGSWIGRSPGFSPFRILST